ncbi:receptor-type tyrosine-protein phosphatase beta-like [Centroberyx affinis]|uniref:receptor-type tyrosine-protein phosphatase beta-like n=1 Tax=Centroberyx affinis TaxID=166261 RepID=UPI003A5BF865
MHTPRGLCLLTYRQTVILGRCEATDPAQQWEWTGGARLIHAQSSRCLWADPSPGLPRHARLVTLSNCTDAPVWKCYGAKGAFGLAETPMYLKKQGLRLVIRGDPRYSNWAKYDVDSGGNDVMTSLCQDTDRPTIDPSSPTYDFQKRTYNWLDLTHNPLYNLTSSLIRYRNSQRSNNVYSSLDHGFTKTQRHNSNSPTHHSKNHTHFHSHTHYYSHTHYHPYNHTHQCRNNTSHHQYHTHYHSNNHTHYHRHTRYQQSHTHSHTHHHQNNAGYHQNHAHCHSNHHTQNNNSCSYHNNNNHGSPHNSNNNHGSSHNNNSNNNHGSSHNTTTTAPPTTTTATTTTAPPTTIQTTEAARCCVNFTDINTNSDSVVVTLTTTGQSCNFTAVNEDTRAEVTDCDPYGEFSNVFVCEIRDLAPGTLLHLAVISKRDGERANMSVRTDPVGPARLDVQLDQAQAQYRNQSPVQSGTSGLRVSWPRSPGHVDWYELTLEDNSTGSSRSTRVMGSAAPRSGFTSLTPGSLYTLSLVATAGNKSAPPVQTTAATAPSSVSGLQVASSSSGSLGVSWQAGPGRTELFRVLLRDQEGVLVRNVTLENTVTSATLPSLRPGTLYTVTVVAEAVGLQSSVSKQAATAPAAVSDLRLDNNGSSETLRASWASPGGGVDSYLVTLSAQQGPAHPPRRLAPNATQALFRGLTPGRSYQLAVRTEAAGRSTEARSSGRTVPDSVSRLSMSALGDGRTLAMTWSPPRGEWESYGVLLWNGSAPLVNETVGKLVSRRSFPGPGLSLVPGRLYRAEVTVHSGLLGNTAHCQGRLAPRPVQQLVVRHSDETTLSVLWNRPAGEWEGFTVVLRHVEPAGVVSQKTLPWEARECTFNILTPGRLYAVTVTTNSGNLTSSASVTGWTTPAQVTQLQVSNGGSTDSLQAQWERAAGDLDSYRVLLVHDSSVIKNESVAADTTGLSFPALRPGALYRVVVTTVRAGQTSRQSVAEGRTVPAAVGEVTVSNNGRMDFLSVSWRPPPGDVDGYLVTLRDREKTLHTLAVSKSSPECVFNSLVSGRLYNISITSRSGVYENHTVVQERTQPSRVQNPTATHAARDDYLKVYWRHAAGDFDFYQVVIKHNNIFHQNKTVAKTQNECVFSGLEPGRLYTVLVSTWSGSYETSISTDGRTFPAAVRSLSLAGRGTEDLRVTWSAAPGDVDHYEVQLLFNDMKVFPPITLGSGVGECVLSSLTPGRLYKILVSTFSGPNQRAQFIEGRTGDFHRLITPGRIRLGHP